MGLRRACTRCTFRRMRATSASQVAAGRDGSRGRGRSRANPQPDFIPYNLTFFILSNDQTHPRTTPSSQHNINPQAPIVVACQSLSHPPPPALFHLKWHPSRGSGRGSEGAEGRHPGLGGAYLRFPRTGPGDPWRWVLAHLKPQLVRTFFKQKIVTMSMMKPLPHALQNINRSRIGAMSESGNSKDSNWKKKRNTDMTTEEASV